MSAVSPSDRIKQLFNAALETEPVERTAFLAAACAGDDELRHDIESLLSLFIDRQDFLEQPASELSAAHLANQVLIEDRDTSIAEQCLGPYRTIREIGRGGMGTVYLAARVDGHYQQQVAVKVIKRGMDSEEVLRRFRRERQILADLAHPYISRLLDGGVTGDGRPYFVMEYVEGLAIDEHARVKQLSTSERLELFLLVCEAAKHAHEHGVIHRDLKPSNILIKADGTPTLLDFGIAKLLDSEREDQSTAVTAASLRLMTPEYASPEQVYGLPLTAASDVYSLGVVLHKLLTGFRPNGVEKRASQDVPQSMISKNVNKPSTALSRFQLSVSERIAAGRSDPSVMVQLNVQSSGRVRDLRGDLNNILLKALRPELERRYASVEQFAEDIRRHLDGSPILARRDTLWYRGTKFLKRNQAAVISALTVALACLLLAALLARPSETGKPRGSIAVLPFVCSGSKQDMDYLTDGITDGLIDSLARLPHILVPAHNSVFRYKGRTADPLTVGRELNVETVLTGTVTVDRDDISVRTSLFEGSNNQELWSGQYSGKSWDVQLIRQQIAHDVASKLGVKAADDAGMRSHLGGTQDSEAYRLYLRGNYFWNERSVEALNKAVTYFQQAVGKDPNYALAYCGLANSYSLLGAYESVPAAEAFGKARVAARRAVEIDPSLSEGHTSLAMTAWLYDWDWAAADAEFSRAIELNPNYPTAHHWYGLYLGEMGRFDQAIEEEKRALLLDPVSVPVYADLGRVYFYARRYHEALAQYQKALELDPGWEAFYVEIALLYEQLGMSEQMIQALTKSSHRELTEAYSKQELGGYWRKCLALLNAKPVSFDTYHSRAQFYARLGQKEKALEQLWEAYEVRDHMMTQLRVNPVFDSLRSEPQFVELLKRMHLAL